ncbi:hypothetical protein V6C59_04260 [Acinetobacter bereziniae]|uniref:hypothetical protein n=1 Tax=Acinetobacter bereziniae TaxID=106648 RepID=UPI002FD914BE
MTFLLSIQLKDSIIIAADKRSVKIQACGEFLFNHDQTNKLHLWKNGVITGTGELTVIQWAISFLDELANNNIDQLANCLTLSRLIRKFEFEHPQINQTKLIYSEYTEYGAQLYAIELNNRDDYFVRKLEENEITIWMYNPDITGIIAKVKNLYDDLKPLNEFDDILDGLNFYFTHISKIFALQSKQDEMMSSDFDIYFQIYKNYYIGTFKNK